MVLLLRKASYKEFAYQDDRIITGQNPFSVRAVARLLIQQLSNETTATTLGSRCCFDYFFFSESRSPNIKNFD